MDRKRAAARRRTATLTSITVLALAAGLALAAAALAHPSGNFARRATAVGRRPGTVVRHGGDSRRPGLRRAAASTVPSHPANLEPDTPTFFADGLGQYDNMANNANSTFTRGYWALVPKSYKANNRTPETLVVWSHGCEGTAISDLYNQLDPTYDPSKFANYPFISIYLQGPDAGYDSTTGDPYPGPYCWNPKRDEAQVLRDIREAETHFNINRRRIIIAGYSSGGDLSYWTIFHHADEFAGILAQNTSPWRDTGAPSLKYLIKLAAWHFNIRQVATKNDGEYHLNACGFGGHPACQPDAGGIGNRTPDPGIEPAFTQLRKDGWKGKATLIVRPGSHYDGNTCGSDGCYGTYYDEIKYLLDSVAHDGWKAPAKKR